MPKYRVTSPDGKSFDINAPEGASQDDVMEYAQSQYSAPQSPYTGEGPPVEEQVLGGPVKGVEGAFEPGVFTPSASLPAISYGLERHQQAQERLQQANETARGMMKLAQGPEDNLTPSQREAREQQLNENIQSIKNPKQPGPGQILLRDPNTGVPRIVDEKTRIPVDVKPPTERNILGKEVVPGTKPGLEAAALRGFYSPQSLRTRIANGIAGTLTSETVPDEGLMEGRVLKAYHDKNDPQHELAVQVVEGKPENFL